MGLVAPRHVGSSQTRARTRVPCIGRQILNHCTTREALSEFLNRVNAGSRWGAGQGCDGGHLVGCAPSHEDVELLGQLEVR